MRFLKVGACLAATVLVFVLLSLHTPGMNGPSYWRWYWQDLSWRRVALCFALAAIPFAVGQYLYATQRWSARRSLAALALSVSLMTLASVGVRVEPFSFTRAMGLIEKPTGTSYFTDAEGVIANRSQSLGKWLEEFPKILPTLNLHSTTKPPGPILFYVPLVQLFGPGHPAAAVSVLVLALLTGLGVFAVYHFVRVFTGDEAQAFWGASFYAVTPGILVVTPGLDQVHSILTCAMLGLWATALAKRSLLWAGLAGFVIATCTLFTYNVATLGFFLVGYTVISWAWGEKGQLGRVLLQCTVCLAGFVLFYALGWLLVRYDPIASFKAAMVAAKGFQAAVKRPYPLSVPWDLEDFALALGWMPLLLLGFALARRQPGRERAVALLGVAQVVVVALTGLLAGETARIFLFLVPLIALPVAGELARWKPLERAVVFACLIALAIAESRNLVFFD